MKKNIFVFLLVVAALVLLAGCPQKINKNKAANPQGGGGTPPTPGTPNFTVTFNVQGIGTLPAGKETLSVLKGHKIDAADMPSPTHLTWDFIGWYKDKNCNTQWNTASDTVTADITLYAKWTPKNLLSQDLWKSKETAGTNNHFRIPALTQTKDGKLIAVTDLRYDHAADVGQFGGRTHRVDLVMKHSTDFGLTWSANGSSGVNLTNVPVPVEYGCGDAAIVADRDSNAVLIIHVRGNVKYQDGKQSVYKLRSNDGGTNGEILILKAVRVSDKTPATIALLSFPKTHSRQNVTVFWRTIEDNISLTDFADGTKWQEKLIKTGDSAYSTMILQSDNRIGFLYEADGIPTDHYSRGYIIRYESLPISAITDGEYEAAFLTE